VIKLEIIVVTMEVGWIAEEEVPRSIILDHQLLK